MACADEDTLTSVRATQSIAIDGQAEAAWQKAPVLKIELDQTVYEPSNGYPGMPKTEVSLRSFYDDQYVYFLMEYADPTYSIDRFPWIRQADGSWKQRVNKDSTGHDNTYYEDKVAFFWNINAASFDKKGCAAACHRASGGKVNGIEDKSPGRKFTKPGETIDMWHWKGVRTNPNHQMDDQYVDSTNDPKQNKEWGRKGDHKTGGGYKDNIADGQPAFIAKDLSSKTAAIKDAEKIPFAAQYGGSDRIPGIVTAPFTGSRGDLEAFGHWQNGVWTLEIKRALVTKGEQAEQQDVQFRDLKAEYPFGVAVFDNSQINHIFHYGTYELKFE